jgi:hypothetical protein
MAKLNTKHASVIHRCIIYGGPKAGKTMLAGKLSEYYNIIWFDLENGHETLFQLPEAWQERIELIDIPDTRSFPMAIETCLKVVKQKCVICEAHGKVACMICQREEAPTVTVDLPAMKDLNTVVVFDSLTQLTNSAIAFITKSRPDDYKMEFDDWGNLGKLLEIFLSHIQQSGYHVIVISHEQEIVTEGKKAKLVPVGGTRNFSRNVAKYFDHVIYAEIKNRKHTFASSTTYATTILTGSRTGAVLDAELEPSLLQIFKPELYPTSDAVPSNKSISTKKETTANNTLARLANLKK